MRPSPLGGLPHCLQHPDTNKPCRDRADQGRLRLPVRKEKPDSLNPPQADYIFKYQKTGGPVVTHFPYFLYFPNGGRFFCFYRAVPPQVGLRRTCSTPTPFKADNVKGRLWHPHPWIKGGSFEMRQNLSKGFPDPLHGRHRLQSFPFGRFLARVAEGYGEGRQLAN